MMSALTFVLIEHLLAYDISASAVAVVAAASAEWPKWRRRRWWRRGGGRKEYWRMQYNDWRRSHAVNLRHAGRRGRRGGWRRRRYAV